MAAYNRTRTVEALLERTESLPPSFSVHLFPEYWTLNNGSKFLYNLQIASLLDDIRAHRIPVDFLDLFDAAKVPFYDGCMVVELLDYRPQKPTEPALDNPERTRAVLHPNGESLWGDICLLNQKHADGKWTDRDALEVEARILLATAPPLCLDPDPHLTRIANHVLRVSTPTVPVSLKRKAAALDPEEDETDKARRAKIMQFMNPRQNRSHTPSYRMLDAIQRARQGKDRPPSTAPQPQNGMSFPQVPSSETQQHASSSHSSPATSYTQANSPTNSEDPSRKKLKPKKKPDMPQPPYAIPDRGSGTHTPASLQGGFHPSSHHSPSPISQSPMLQPRVFNNVQAAVDSAKRVPTPAQRYTHSPQVPPQQPSAAAQQLHPPQNQPPQPPTTTFQPIAPNTHFLQQPPAGLRSVQPKAPPPNAAQAQAQANQQMYSHQYHQIQMQQAALQRNGAAGGNASAAGRATPQGGAALGRGSPLNAAQAQAAAAAAAAAAQGSGRGSPMGQPPAARSPMPPGQVPAMAHGAHIAYPAQFSAHFRQALPPHLANATVGAGQGGHEQSPQAAQAQAQAQAAAQAGHAPAMMPYQPVFGYQVGYGMQARMPAGYAAWPMGMGRGMPGVGGQPMPGMPAGGAHAQQMPVGKAAVQGGLPR